MTDDVSVKVGVRIRPQIPREIIDMCRVCTMVTPGEPQVTLGSDKSFTYNYVFDMSDTQDTVYEKCVSNLIESALEGYNATVLAYGQTGSGKTYTMGTGFDVELTEDQIGIIPRAIQHIFDGIEEKTKLAKENDDLPPEFTITSQFMELYNEDIIDLFDPIRDGAKNIIKIHEDPHGGIVVSGVETKPVTSIEDAMKCLRVGALSRTTASTQMNSQSSRSHAIFTLLIKQQRLVKVENPTSEEPTNEFETLTAKFHFVDLAGSERLKRTGATGERAKEGISINCGLLALGNVISALGDKSKKALHVPYRDSKLTRLLQDSLGGNSKTLMIACVSPSDRDFMETLNTLKYANRARNIKNRVVINQDKSSRTINLLRQEIAQLQLELLEFKQGKRIIGDDGNESINDMYHENKMLQTELNNLRMRVKGMQETIDALSIKNTELLTEKATGAWMNSETNMDVADMVKAYMREIEELRAKLLESDFMCQNLQKQVNKYQANRSHYHIDSGIDTEDTSSVIVQAKRELKKDIDILHQSMHRDTGTENLDDDNDVDYPNKDIDNDYNDASSSDTDSDEKENYGSELAELTANINMKQKLIEELELSQKRLQTMKQHYEDKLMQLQVRIKDTEHERDKVLSSIGGYNKQPNDKMKKVKDEYERKLCDMQKELKRLQAAKKEHARLLQSQSQHESQLRSLKNDLTEMKRIKVKLINQMKEESARHKQAETKRIQEIAQLRKESRKNANTIRTLETDKRMKEQVLRRKQEELMALRRHNKGHISQISKHTFSAKVAKQKWHSLEKNIHKIVLSKQVMAFQERDMNRLVLRRESLGRDLESLRQRKEALEIQNDDSAIEVDVEIENMMAELNYIQESITESQHHIMQVEDSKENNEGNNIQDVTQSINNVEEAKYLIEKLFNLALTQSYNAAERDLKIQEKETELEHMKQEHNMVNQLLEYMVQKSIEPNITMTTSTSSNGNESDQSSKDSSRSVSPIDSIVQDRSYQEPLKRSKEKDPVVRSKVRKRMAVTRDLLFGTQHEVRDVQSKSQDSESLKQLFANPLVRVPSAPGSLKGLLPLRQNNQSDLLKQPSVVRKLAIPSDRQEPSITSPSMARRPIPSFHSTASLKHESTEQSLTGSGSPPGSPSMLRRSLGIREDNVFSRLAASSIEGNIHQQRGAINPYTGKVNTREPLQCISVAEGHNNGVLSVRVTDVSLLTGSIDRTARLWDLTTGIETSILFGHPSNVVAVDCDLSSTIAVTASASVIKVWDLRASPINCVTVLNSSGTSQPGSSYVATRTVQLPIGESQINDVKFNNSGKYIYSASGEKVSVWDLRKFSIVGKLSGGHQAAVMCLSLKEMQNGNDFVVTGSKDHYIKGFNVNPNNVGSLSATMNLEPPHYDGIQSLALGEDMLFSGSRDTCIKKWDLRKEELVQSLNNAHKGWICGLSLMRNNSLLVSGCRTGYIRLWDVTSCEPLANMRAHNSAINAVATNSTHVFTASSDRKVKAWKINEKNLGVARLKRNTSTDIDSLKL